MLAHSACPPSMFATPPPELIPLLFLLDFACAFPSVAHAWLFIVLHAINMPIGLIRFIESMYKFANAVIRHPNGTLHVVYALLSGVLYDDFPFPFVPRPTWLGNFIRNLVVTAGMYVDDRGRRSTVLMLRLRPPAAVYRVTLAVAIARCA